MSFVKETDGNCNYYIIFKIKILFISFSITHVRPISEIYYHEQTMGSKSLQYDNLRKPQKVKHVFKYIKDSNKFSRLHVILMYSLSVSPYPNGIPSSIVSIYYCSELFCLLYIQIYIYLLHAGLIRSCNITYSIRQKDFISLIITCVYSLFF